MILETAQLPPAEYAAVCQAPLRIYTGILGQIGDIIMFTATARRLKEIFPNARLTFAIARQYAEVGDLLAGLPYIDRLFVTECYFERMQPAWAPLWEQGWPFDLRGEDEIAEQRQHDLVLETRPRHRRSSWWEVAHQVEELAHSVGVPGPICRRTEVALPPDVRVPPEAVGKVVLHNDPALDARKAWDWNAVREVVRRLGTGQVVLLGRPGPDVPGALDWRGRTTLAQAATILAQCAGYIGVDSGLMWIAGSLGVPTVGLYGTAYIPAYQAIYPENPQAVYLQAEGSPCLIGPEAVLNALYGLRLRRQDGAGDE